MTNAAIERVQMTQAAIVESVAELLALVAEWRNANLQMQASFATKVQALENARTDDRVAFEQLSEAMTLLRTQYDDLEMSRNLGDEMMDRVVDLAAGPGSVPKDELRRVLDLD